LEFLFLQFFVNKALCTLAIYLKPDYVD